MKTRNPLFDLLKFFAIVMVVFWHVAEAVGYTGLQYFDNFRLVVNMPVFFALAGFFARGTLMDADVGHFFRSLRSYFWPAAVIAFVFAVLYFMITMAFSDLFAVGTAVDFTMYALKRFLFAPWFVWVLAVTYAVLFFGCWLTCRFKVPVWVSVLTVIAVVYFTPPRFWWFRLVRSQLPFFVFGAFVIRPFYEFHRDWLDGWQFQLVGGSSLLACALACVFGGNFHLNGLSFYHTTSSPYEFVMRPELLVQFDLRLLLGVAGIVGSVWLADILCKVSFFRRLSVLGTTTLGVYLLHQWILDRLVDFAIIPNSTLGVVVFAALLFFSCHFLTSFTSFTAGLRRWLWGKW